MGHAKPLFLESLEGRQLLSAAVPVATLASDAPPVAETHYVRAAAATTDLSDDLRGVIAGTIVPGIAGAVIKNGQLVAEGAAGKRVRGESPWVRPTDQFAIGSVGKAMTATLIAKLVEARKLTFDTTLGQIFPELSGKVKQQYLNATVWQVMTERSGLSDLKMIGLPLVQYGLLGIGSSPREVRAKMLTVVLNTDPVAAPGAKFEYSNFAYGVLGAVAERVGKSNYEKLMWQYVFNPLGMTSPGFGAPGSSKKVNQPRGHLPEGTPVSPGSSTAVSDPTGGLNPAGLMYMNLQDWAKFLQTHMDGKTPDDKRRYLRPGTLARLHTPYDGPGTRYAAGWAVVNVAGRTVLAHDGAPGLWHSRVILDPDAQYASFAAVNYGGDAGQDVVEEAVLKQVEVVPF